MLSPSCVSCGAEVAEGARFCHVCGASLQIRCPTCGTEQAASAAFCSACGSALQPGVRRTLATEQEERRVVTILFADLAGSTALGERLDPEDVRALQAELFELVNAEVERFGGVTEKFIGDAILAVFGAPQTHEDDAERAVRAALAIRDGFPAFAHRVGTEHGGEIGIRIGVNTGEVIAGREAVARGELMVTGDAVNVAARLQQLADPGDVLVGERTRQATQRAISYGERADLAAKGKALPVAAWRALDAIVSPGQERPGSGAPLIGRDDELALLRLAASRVERERAPQLVTVFGQAGVGKSRLVSDFVGGLEAARVLIGRCVPYGDGITYLPLAEVARALAELHEDDPTDTALEQLRRSVAAAVPEDQVGKVIDAVAWTMGLSLPGHSSSISVGGDARRTFHDAWTRYLAALGRVELVVLVVEDIHWASEPLLDLLEDVIDALEDTAVLIVCPSRPELLDTRPSWGTGRLNASAVTLTPLNPRDARGLLEALLGAETIQEHVSDRILSPAEGNPFFVEEMLAMLVERGAIEAKDGRWVETVHLATARVPDSIHGVIAARMDLLDAPEREALRRCSVMGRYFWPSAVGVDDDVIAALGRRAIVSEQGESAFSGRREFAFKHALTHEVAYATLPRGERRDLHRRVAGWITDTTPDRYAETTELIAYHYEQALQYGERDDELEQRAFAALLSAGEAAISRGAYSSAEGLLARSLEVAPSELEHARALLLAGRLDLATVNYGRAVERLEEVVAVAGRHHDSMLRADALGWNARVRWLSGKWREALGSAEGAVAALQGLPESTELARALARLSQIQMLRSSPAAGETSAHAIEVARRTGERTAEANARTNLFTVRSSEGVTPDTVEVGAIVNLALSAGAPDEAARAVVNYLWSAALLDDLQPTEVFVTEMVERLGRAFAAEAYEQYLGFSLAALIYVPAARWAEVEDVIERTRTIDSVTTRLVWFWLVTGHALRRGDLETVDRYLPEFRETALASEEPQRILPMASVAMPRAVLGGDVDTVGELADVVFAQEVHGVTMSAATMSICRSLAAVGDRERLHRYVHDRQDIVARAPGSMLTFGQGLVALLDARADDASKLLLDAEERLRSLGRHYDAACVALDLTRALSLTGDEAGAEAAQARADALLGRLACVNPY